MKKLLAAPAASIMLLIALCGCGDNNPSKAADDLDKTAALKKVTLSYDSASPSYDFPDSALSGKSFDSLKAADSAVYCDPSNYTVNFTAFMTADNTEKDADDAKFDGLRINIVMDTIESSPVETLSEAFEIGAGEIKDITADGSVNLETHKSACLYIFRQIVDGNDLVSTLMPFLKYSIGGAEGEIDIKDIEKEIPTRASDDLKNFLQGLLDSGVFEEE
ncbi:MAG: hypothetical protein ACLFQK_09750 [Fibrobacterota bacterium]